MFIVINQIGWMLAMGNTVNSIMVVTENNTMPIIRNINCIFLDGKTRPIPSRNETDANIVVKNT